MRPQMSGFGISGAAALGKVRKGAQGRARCERKHRLWSLGAV